MGVLDTPFAFASHLSEASRTRYSFVYISDIRQYRILSLPISHDFSEQILNLRPRLGR